MASRQGVLKTVIVPVDGGQSPNAYLGRITAEVRVHWPPGLGHEHEAVQAIVDAAYAAITEILDGPSASSWDTRSASEAPR